MQYFSKFQHAHLFYSLLMIFKLLRVFLYDFVQYLLKLWIYLIVLNK